MVDISGRTRLIAHLGVPTEIFKAPMIYNPWFEHAGIDAVVVPMGSEPADYPDFFRLLFRLRNIHGALITMPHKVTTVGLLDRISPTVEVAGSCNAVRLAADGLLEGDMFDGEGFVRGMQAKGRPIAGASALVVGAGGVGSAIAASLAKAAVARLGLFDLNRPLAEARAQRIARRYPAVQIAVGDNDAAGFDILVNATPLGINADDPMPTDMSRVAPETFVGDVVMSAEETAFLAAARARGCQTQIGLDMNFEQIPAYLEFFGLPVAAPDQLRRLARIRY